VSSVFLFAVAAFALAPAKVTLLFKAGPVTKAVEEIAKLTEAPLFADGGLATDIVCLDVHDVALDDLKAKLAETIGAIWVDRDGKQVLYRPDWMDAQQRKEALAAKTERIRQQIALRPELPEYNVNTIKGMLAEVADASQDMGGGGTEFGPNHDKARQKQWASLTKTPAHRLLERIVKKMPPEQFAALRPDQRICYSNEPNGSERRLPFDIRPLLDQFRKEQLLFLQTATSQDTAPWSKQDDHRYLYYDASPDSRRVLLVVNMARRSENPFLELDILDGDGWKSGVAFLSLTPPPFASNGSAENTKEQIRFSDDAVQFQKLKEALMAPSKYDFYTKEPIQPRLDAWLDRLLDPVRFEPLGLSASEAILQYAAWKKMPLIALIPDRALQWPTGGPKTLPMTVFAEQVKTSWRAELKAEDGWVTCRPTLLSGGRDERINRAALKTFFRRVKNDDAMTVDGSAIYVVGSRSELVFESYDQGAPGLAEPYQGDFEPRQLSLWYYRAILRFLGRLSPAQRSSLLAGNALTVADLGSSGRQIVEDVVFSDDLIDRIFSHKDWGSDDPKKERGHSKEQPWEMLPNGIPGTTRISCTRKRVPVFLTEWEDSHILTSFTAEEYGNTLAGGETPGDALLGEGHEYVIHFDFAPGVSGETTIRELLPGRRLKVKRLEDLPEDVRALVAKGIEAEKERLRNSRPNTTRTSPPPWERRL